MNESKSFNSLYLLIVILIVVCLALITGFTLGTSYKQEIEVTPSLEPQIAENGCILISSLPYLIQSSGHYCLTGTLTTDEHGISILADNVLLDFNGYSIHGSQEPGNIFYGVYANDQSNIHIRNGEITGFLYGVRIDDSSYSLNTPFESGWHTIENMEILHSTFRGIAIIGNGNVIRNNSIRHIQGSLIEENSFAIGIESAGPGALIQNNYLYEIRGMGIADIGEGIGIAISENGDGSIITYNVISNNSLEPSNLTDWEGLSRSTWGIWVGGTSNVSVSYNQIHNYMNGIGFPHTTTDSLIYNNTIMGAYLPLSMDVLGSDVGDDEQAHTAVNNICDYEDCFRGLELIQP